MTEDDRIALTTLLTQTGVGRPQGFRHFIYIPDQARAKALAAKLLLAGFEVECRMGADGLNWLLLVGHMMVPDERVIEQLRVQLTGLAEAMDGEYDGWEAYVGER